MTKAACGKGCFRGTSLQVFPPRPEAVLLPMDHLGPPQHNRRHRVPQLCVSAPVHPINLPGYLFCPIRPLARPQRFPPAPLPSLQAVQLNRYLYNPRFIAKHSPRAQESSPWKKQTSKSRHHSVIESLLLTRHQTPHWHRAPCQNQRHSLENPSSPLLHQSRHTLFHLSRQRLRSPRAQTKRR
jgi:hypothetical protein